jgi:hypothetical protein
MWAQLLGTCLGIWLMAAPAVLGYGGAARANDRVVGPLAATVAAVAISEVTRPVRWANLLTGAWLFAAPWVLGSPWAAAWNSLFVGAALAALALAGGTVKGRYGGGWSAVWRPTRDRPGGTAG